MSGTVEGGSLTNYLDLQILLRNYKSSPINLNLVFHISSKYRKKRKQCKKRGRGDYIQPKLRSTIQKQIYKKKD